MIIVQARRVTRGVTSSPCDIFLNKSKKYDGMQSRFEGQVLRKIHMTDCCLYRISTSFEKKYRYRIYMYFSYFECSMNRKKMTINLYLQK